MRKNSLTLALAGLVAASIFGTVCLLMIYQQSTKEYYTRRSQQAYLQSQQALLTGLEMDLRAHAKAHPELIPLLKKHSFTFEGEGK